jgi:alpha-1,6-rhamnosyltransferase
VAGEVPLVAAVMAVYNGEAFLEQALASLLAQDYPRVDAVVCDDGSTDATAEILASTPGIRVVRQENRGPAAARNAAIAASRGEFVAVFDADDLWPAERLSLQVAHLQAHPELGCVLGRQEWLNPPPWLTRDAVYGELDGIPANAGMVRRSVLDELGGFDPAFRAGGDTDLLVRMREHGIAWEVMPDVVLRRRFHGANLSAEHTASAWLIRSLRGKLARERAGAPGQR